MDTLCLLSPSAHMPMAPLDNSYSQVEIAVLQLAADILRVSVEDLARVRDLLTPADFTALARVQSHVHPAVTAPPPPIGPTLLAPSSVGTLISNLSAPVQHDMPPPTPVNMLYMEADPLVAPATTTTQPTQHAFAWLSTAQQANVVAPHKGISTWQQQDYFSGSDTSDSNSVHNSRRSSVDDECVSAAVAVMPHYQFFPVPSPELNGNVHPTIESTASSQLGLHDYATSVNEAHVALPLDTHVDAHEIVCSEWPRVIKPRQSISQASGMSASAGVTPSYRRSRGKKNSTAAMSRTRSAFEPEQRQRTALIRKLKACIRCHLQKEGCGLNPENPDGPCPRCMRLQGPNSTGLPCLRYKISEAQLLDKGAHPRFSWTRRFTSMSIVGINEEAWRSQELKTITLTQDVGVGRVATYELHVREFVPLPGDSLARSWHSKSGLRSHPCTPYAIADMEHAAQTITKFVDENIHTFIEFYIDESDKLMRDTYVMAFRHSQVAERKEEKVLLQSVLRLWVASRMESKQERICSDEVLGMDAQYSDPEATNYGNYLVPPVMQAQIELLTTAAILLPEKEKILKRLENFMKPNQPGNWFTIYLTLFILLHSCALLTQAECRRAAREGFIGSNPRYHNSRLVEEIHNGARTMLAYFHFCNKGTQPFKIDWSSPPNMPFAQLDARQIEFMKLTVLNVEQRREHFSHIKSENNFEDDYYFISQLFESEWRPVHTV